MHRSTHRLQATIISLLIIGTACGSGSGNGDTDTQAQSGTSSPPAPVTQAAAVDFDDPALAERGERLFVERACTTCHTIGAGRLVGPDLSGVTTRREREWTIAMIRNPDSMVRIDVTARALFAEYMTPMANQGLTQDEAHALFAYLKRNDAN
jgi:cytochrome c